MIAIVQRVSSASVEVSAEKYRAEIGAGLLILLGIERGDGEAEAAWSAKKCADLRIFMDGEQKMNRAVKDVGGAALVVSQFTLLGDVRKGNRPSFIQAALPEAAKPLYEYFCERLEREHGVPVKRGLFQALMRVTSVNEGPVTLVVERKAGSAGEKPEGSLTS